MKHHGWRTCWADAAYREGCVKRFWVAAAWGWTIADRATCSKTRSGFAVQPDAAGVVERHVRNG